MDVYYQVPHLHIHHDSHGIQFESICVRLTQQAGVVEVCWIPLPTLLADGTATAVVGGVWLSRGLGCSLSGRSSSDSRFGSDFFGFYAYYFRLDYFPLKI